MHIRCMSDCAYSKRFDMGMSREGAYGIVQSVSRVRIEIATIDTVWEVKSYPTHRRLSQGLYSYVASDGLAYAIRDVRAGDTVSLYLCKEEKTEYCFALSIDRRPGGLVPESRKPRLFASYAEIVNARHIFEEKATPIPRYLVGRKSDEYPFADGDIPSEKRFAKWPKADPFSYIELALFLR